MTTPTLHGMSETARSALPTQVASSFWWELLDTLYDGIFVVDRDGLITSWNRGAEDMTGYAATDVLGTRSEESIMLHATSEGDEATGHGSGILAATLRDGKRREAQCSLRHKEGHWVRVLARAMAFPRSRRQIIGAVLVFTDNLTVVAMKQRLRELRHLALSDPLTELGNRRYGEMSLRVRLDEMRRYGWPFGVLFIDLDGFKTVNDTFGHEVGDRALRMVAKTLSHNVRPFDVVCRWGGEEFLAIIANIHPPQLERLAEKLRSLIQRSSFFSGLRHVRVTVSVGGTTARPNDSELKIVERADKMMYQAKRHGKNVVQVE